MKKNYYDIIEMSSGVKLKGFLSKGKKIEAKVAPPELREVPTPQEEFLDKKPSALTTAVKEMFGKPKKEVVDIPPVQTVSVIPKKQERKTREEKIQEVEEAVEEEYDETLKKLEKLILKEVPLNN